MMFLNYIPIALRKVAFKRVCQPFPCDLKAANRSGSSMMWTDFLRASVGSGGRPRLAVSKKAASSSRTSPSSSMYGSFLDILTFLSFVRFFILLKCRNRL